MNELRTLRSLFELLDPDIKLKALVVSALAFIAAILEVVGALGVLWLIGLVTDPAAMSKLPVIGGLVGNAAGDESRLLLIGCAMVAAFYVAKNAYLLAYTYVQLVLPYMAGTRISTRLFAHYLKMPYAEHLGRNSSELIRNIGSSMDVLFRVVMTSAITIISDLCIAATLVLLLVIASPWQSLLAAASLFVMMMGLLRFSHGVFEKWGDQNLRRTLMANQVLLEAFGGIKDVKIYGREKYFLDQYGKHRSILSDVLCKRETYLSAPRLLLETTLVLILTALVALTVLSGGKAGEVVPLLALYAYAGFRLMPSVGRLAVSVQNIRFGGATLANIKQDIVRANEMAIAVDGQGARLDLEDEIRLEDVSYTYPQANGIALDRISLGIHKGEAFGVAGTTGAGKSTLIDIILGLLQPGSGRVLVDGRDIAGDPRVWQRSIGNVPQFPFLLDDTLRRNIAFGIEDKAIDDDLVRHAAHAAQLDDVIAARAEGLDAVLGERGVRLSGGQRQRIAIARAIYRQPGVLVFDEATSSLDNTTERAVTDAIFSLAQQRTVIVVAHRLSTLERCDRIAFMKAGRIVAVGTFQELVAGVPEFAQMAKREANLSADEVSV